MVRSRGRGEEREKEREGERRIYSEELAHTVLEADKSKNQRAGWQAGRIDVAAQVQRQCGGRILSSLEDFSFRAFSGLDQPPFPQYGR